MMLGRNGGRTTDEEAGTWAGVDAVLSRSFVIITLLYCTVHYSTTWIWDLGLKDQGDRI